MSRYDIRSLNLTREYCHSIGFLFAQHNMFYDIIVGCDSRESSESIISALLDGITDFGSNVINIGFSTTPALTFAANSSNSPGIMVTASHNNILYNGFKFIYNGLQIDPQTFINATKKNSIGKGKIIYYDVSNKYVDYIIKNIQLNDKLKVGLLFVGHAVRNYIERINSLNYNVDFLFLENDSELSLDPSIVGHVCLLSDLIVKNKCDVGFIFDSDVDRIGIVDSDGKNLTLEHISSIIIQDFISKGVVDSYFVLDYKASNVLYTLIKNSGNNVAFSRTGRYFILKNMHKFNAVFGSESSHHIYLGKYGDDALYCALFFISILSQNRDCINKHYLQTHITPEIRIKVKNKNEIMNDLNHFLPNYIVGDGVRFVDSCRNWWMVRSSQTEDVIVIRCEGRCEQSMKKMKNSCKFYLSLCGLNVFI